VAVLTPPPVVHYEDGDVTVWHGDNVVAMAQMPADSVDAVVCDPPYNLEFMGHGWDKVIDFQTWCTQWATEAFRVLKPGGHLLAFGAPRTAHRLTAGIEDAGFDIRDGIAWIYSNGFPKSANVTDGMTAYLDGVPLVVDEGRRLAALPITAFLAAARDVAGWTNADIDRLFGTSGMAGHWTTQGKQPAAPTWEQWSILRAELGFDSSMDAAVIEYGAKNRAPERLEPDGRPFLNNLRKDRAAPGATGWGTALKPSQEPITVARKPFKGPTIRNVADHGVGGLNIDGCRSVDDDGVERWPANVVIDADTAAVLDEVTGSREPWSEEPVDGAARFYPVFRYQGKAAQSERPRVAGEGHVTVKPLELMRWLVRLVTPPGGVVLDPFAGSGTTGEAALAEGMRTVLVEQHGPYLPLIMQRVHRSYPTLPFEVGP